LTPPAWQLDHGGYKGRSPMAKGKGKAIKKSTAAQEIKEPASEPQPLAPPAAETGPPPSKRERYGINEYGDIQCLDCHQQAAALGFTASPLAKLTAAELQQDHYRAVIGRRIDIETIKHLHSLAGSQAMLIIISHDTYQHMDRPAE